MTGRAGTSSAGLRVLPRSVRRRRRQARSRILYAPVGLRTIVDMLQPYDGTVYEPCCGSSGMFVQAGRFFVSHGGRIATSRFTVMSRTTPLGGAGLDAGVRWNIDGTSHRDELRTCAPITCLPTRLQRIGLGRRSAVWTPSCAIAAVRSCSSTRASLVTWSTHLG